LLATFDVPHLSHPPLPFCRAYLFFATLFLIFVASSLSVNDSRRQRQWETHTSARAKMRDRQAQRIEEEKKSADHELEELRRRKDDVAARQLIRQDKMLKQEAKKADEVSRKKQLDEKHERNRLMSDGAEK